MEKFRKNYTCLGFSLFLHLNAYDQFGDSIMKAAKLKGPLGITVEHSDNLKEIFCAAASSYLLICDLLIRILTFP